MKVKKATHNSIGRLHVELGPIYKATLLSQCKDSMRDQLEKTLDSHPYDPSVASAEWPKVSVAVASNSGGQGGSDSGLASGGGNGMALEIPRMDLMATIPVDCVAKMVRLGRLVAQVVRTTTHMD